MTGHSLLRPSPLRGAAQHSAPGATSCAGQRREARKGSEKGHKLKVLGRQVRDVEGLQGLMGKLRVIVRSRKSVIEHKRGHV